MSKVEFRRREGSVQPLRRDLPVDLPAWMRSLLSSPDTLAATDSAVFIQVIGVLLERIAVAQEAVVAAQPEPVEQASAASCAQVLRRPATCIDCLWCVNGSLCTVDPPLIWRGENSCRFVRPEVGVDTPACSRAESRG